MQIETIKTQKENLAPFLDRLADIYINMDGKYNEAADYYGFCCRGCSENCCFTRFYHHTFIEYLYILEGLEALGHGNQTEIREKALLVCRQADEMERAGLPVRLLCPLNYEGLCALYSYRPMICRLHGIPHELIIPGREKVLSPGCGEFMSGCGEKEYLIFDRTPFYTAMAVLEKELKAAFGISERIKLTVARMLAF